MSQDESIEEIRKQKMQELQGEETNNQQPSEGDVPSEPVHVHGVSELEELTASNDVVLVDFHADWCGPCKMIEPHVAEIAADTEAAVGKVDVDANQQLASQYGVRGVPTLLLFVGGEVEDRIVGAQGRDALFNTVTQHL